MHQKVVQIIREEMDAIGCQEMLMPVLTPLELWQQSKRDFIDELFRLKDRKGADYVLPLTHEETVTFHARELQSYRQLPQMLYHFAIKERDEPRPRSGLIRVREFIMKDAYSFDRDEAGLGESFDRQRGAYVRIFERCGLLTHDVVAEPGMMGGSESRDFLAPAGAGENTLVTCENGDFAADIEVATTAFRGRPCFPERLDAPEEVETPGVTTIEALAELLGIDASCDVEGDAAREAGRDGRARAGPRGRPARGAEARGRVRRAALARRRRADPRRIRRVRRLARPGRLHGRGRRRRRAAARGSSSPARTATGGTCAASRPGATTRPRFADLRASAPTDTCPNCGGALRFQTAIEVGHIFKLGTRYSEPLGATFLDEDGQREAARDGLLRDRAWPRDGGGRRAAPRRARDRLAEGDRAVRRPRRRRCRGWRSSALEVAEALAARGQTSSSTTATAAPGEKFADADLIGIPVRVTVGKKTLEDGAVDLKDRSTGDERRVAVDDVAEAA